MNKSLLKKFYLYQKIRFPLVILSLSLLPALLSTSAILMKHPSLSQIIFGVLASILYLLHVRVNDEKRDFTHDNKFHKSRPIQSGIITLGELQIIGKTAAVLFLIIALFAGSFPFFLGLAMLCYSYFSREDFFNAKILRPHFFIYNGINILQTFMLQLFAYSFFAGLLHFNLLIFAHFIFTSTGTIIFELVRKIMIPGKDGKGKDTYSWHLGFKNAVVIYMFLIFFVIYTFQQVIEILSTSNESWLLFDSILFIILSLFPLIHFIKKTVLTEQLMQLSFVSIYSILNLTIFFQANRY